jgi:hypothetical protein
MILKVSSTARTKLGNLMSDSQARAADNVWTVIGKLIERPGRIASILRYFLKEPAAILLVYLLALVVTGGIAIVRGQLNSHLMLFHLFLMLSFTAVYLITRKAAQERIEQREIVEEPAVRPEDLTRERVSSGRMATFAKWIAWIAVLAAIPAIYASWTTWITTPGYCNSPREGDSAGEDGRGYWCTYHIKPAKTILGSYPCYEAMVLLNTGVRLRFRQIGAGQQWSDMNVGDRFKSCAPHLMIMKENREEKNRTENRSPDGWAIVWYRGTNQ